MTSVVETPPAGGQAGEDALRRRFEQVFTTTSDAVLSYALRRVDAPEDAADVLAETFLVAWRRIQDVPPGDAGRLWLYGVARRVLANHRRGSNRRRNLGSKLATTLSDHISSPTTDAVETGLAVRRALARLHEDDRELIRLSSWEGLTPVELSTVLAIPAVTVRTRLHRARQRLRVQLIATGLNESDGAGERTGPAGHVPGDARPPVDSEEGSR